MPIKELNMQIGNSKFDMLLDFFNKTISKNTIEKRLIVNILHIVVKVFIEVVIFFIFISLIYMIFFIILL